MQKPMFAAILAICSAVAFAANANAEARSYGKYIIQSPALAAPAVVTQSAVIAPAATTVVQEPMLQQTLVMPAVITMPAGFSMDAGVMRLYTGPRFENTLTEPDPMTYLRP